MENRVPTASPQDTNYTRHTQGKITTARMLPAVVTLWSKGLGLTACKEMITDVTSLRVR